MKHISSSLIITTYNRPKALHIVLLSVLQQTKLPDEIIIADDGSTQETRDLILSLKDKFPIPLHHSWQEDTGFRLSASRNKAIALSKSDYIILIDGDMLLQKNYIEDHIKIIQKNTMYISSRVFLNEQKTKEIEESQNITITYWDKQIQKNRHNQLRLNFLKYLLPKIKTFDKAKGYMAFWKQDCITVNGFDETYEGWGREDSDFMMRMIHSGIKAYKIKGKCISYHLYHKEADRSLFLKNDKQLQEVIKSKKIKCKKGIDQYLNIK